MKPQFGVNSQGAPIDQTPPTTGVHGSGQENENSRKNTMNHKQKQGKHKPSKGTPYGESDSSGKKKGGHLADLPGLNSKKDPDYDFGGFDDFGDGDSDRHGGRVGNAEKYLNEFDNEQKEGFRVEVKKPGSKQQTSSGKKKNKFNKHSHMGNIEDVDDIEEDIPTDRDKDFLGHNLVSNIERSGAGITVSQSLGIDPSVDSLALDEYDHIEVVDVS